MHEPGLITYLTHKSKALEDNFLGDPFKRTFPVYLPPGYSDDDQSYPVIFGLAGFTGSGDMLLNKSFFYPSLSDTLDKLIHEEGMPPAIYVFPNCLTKLGGSQYVNSSAVGRYEDYIIKELVPLIDQTFRTTKRRACIGGLKWRHWVTIISR